VLAAMGGNAVAASPWKAASEELTHAARAVLDGDAIDPLLCGRDKVVLVIFGLLRRCYVHLSNLDVEFESEFSGRPPFLFRAHSNCNGIQGCHRCYYLPRTRCRVGDGFAAKGEGTPTR